MFYKFNKAGEFLSEIKTQEPYSTDVAPPMDDTKKWIWNGLNWVGVKKSLHFPEQPSASFSRRVPQIEEPVEETVEEPAS